MQKRIALHGLLTGGMERCRAILQLDISERTARRYLAIIKGDEKS